MGYLSLSLILIFCSLKLEIQAFTKNVARIRFRIVLLAKLG